MKEICCPLPVVLNVVTLNVDASHCRRGLGRGRGRVISSGFAELRALVGYQDGAVGDQTRRGGA